MRPDNCRLLTELSHINGLRLSGRPRVQLGRDEPFGGRSAPTAGLDRTVDLCIQPCIPSNVADFEWDEEKAEENLRKHGIDFADAATALNDTMALTIQDPASDEESRFVTLGVDALERLLVVVYTWREDRIRLISARRATRRERRQYEGKRT